MLYSGDDYEERIAEVRTNAWGIDEIDNPQDAATLQNTRANSVVQPKLLVRAPQPQQLDPARVLTDVSPSAGLPMLRQEPHTHQVTKHMGNKIFKVEVPDEIEVQEEERTLVDAMEAGVSNVMTGIGRKIKEGMGGLVDGARHLAGAYRNDDDDGMERDSTLSPKLALPPPFAASATIKQGAQASSSAAASGSSKSKWQSLGGGGGSPQPKTPEDEVLEISLKDRVDSVTVLESQVAITAQKEAMRRGEINIVTEAMKRSASKAQMSRPGTVSPFSPKVKPLVTDEEMIKYETGHLVSDEELKQYE
jgi:hypothetical protein